MVCIRMDQALLELCIHRQPVVQHLRQPLAHHQCRHTPRFHQPCSYRCYLPWRSPWMCSPQDLLSLPYRLLQGLEQGSGTRSPICCSLHRIHPLHYSYLPQLRLSQSRMVCIRMDQMLARRTIHRQPVVQHLLHPRAHHQRRHTPRLDQHRSHLRCKP